MKQIVPTFKSYLEEDVDFEEVFKHVKAHFNSAQTHKELQKLKTLADEYVDEDKEGWDKAAVKYFYELRKTMLGDELDGDTAMNLNKEDGRIMQSHAHRKQYRKTW